MAKNINIFTKIFKTLKRLFVTNIKIVTNNKNIIKNIEFVLKDLNLESVWRSGSRTMQSQAGRKLSKENAAELPNRK